MSPKTLGTSAAVALLALAWVPAASSDDDLGKPVIKGEFEIQPYELPRGWRHVTSTINKDELVFFGGLGAGPPFPPTPMNHTVFTLDLKKAPSEQEWEERNTDDVVEEPWFTSTRGFVQIKDNYYLTCDDSAQDTVYAFDPVTYTFRVLSVSPLDEQFNAQDCCAVGVNVRGEERVYILGGRDSSADPVIPHARYYSITHDRWEQVADMNVSRSHLGCAAGERAGKSLIYAISGGSDPDQGETLRSIEVYDVKDDEWTLYDDFLPEGGGRTRFGVQNVDDKYLLLVGGDATCAGGGPGNLCPPDQPLSTVDIIDIRRGKNQFLSSEEYPIPQLQLPRQSPANSLRKRNSRDQEHRYELYVTAGLTEGEEDLEVTPSTEVLRFDWIKVPTPWVHRIGDQAAMKAFTLTITGAEGARYTGRCTLTTAAGEETVELAGTVPQREELTGEGLTCRIEATGRVAVEINRGGSVSRSVTSGGTINIAVR